MTTPKPEFKQFKKTVEIEPYGYHLHLNYSSDIREAFKRSRPGKIKGGAGPDAKTIAFIWRMNGCTDVYMFIPTTGRANRTKEDIDTIAHESYHITRFVLTQSGVGHCEEAEEAWAYLQGFVTQQVFSFIEKNKA